MATTSWQNELSSLKERHLYAFNNSLFCDIEFSVLDSNEKKVIFKAHKYFFAISSPVFEAMFYGTLAETGPTIDLQDCTMEGLQEMFHYVYSGEANLTGRNVLDVLYLAQKYMMPFLENKCNEYLQKELRPEDVFIILPQAQQVRNEKAELYCWNVVDFQTKNAVMSKAFLDISREMLFQVLARENLHAEEVEIFKAVEKWASNQIEDEKLKDDGATKRKILGEEALRLIRFPVMSTHQFAQFVIDTNILSAREINEIVKVLGSATASCAFNAKERKGQWNAVWSPNRFKKISGDDSRCSDTRHCIQFQVSKPVLLAGVRLFAAQSRKTTAKIKISKDIVSDLGFHVSPKRPKVAATSSNSSKSSKVIYADQERQYTGKLIDDSYQGITVMLDDPVPLEPNEWHLIQVEFGGYCSCFAGIEGQDNVECDEVNIKFKNVRDDDNYTTVEKGQFPSFYLKRKSELK